MQDGEEDGVDLLQGLGVARGVAERVVDFVLSRRRVDEVGARVDVRPERGDGGVAFAREQVGRVGRDGLVEADESVDVDVDVRCCTPSRSKNGKATLFGLISETELLSSPASSAESSV